MKNEVRVETVRIILTEEQKKAIAFGEDVILAYWKTVNTAKGRRMVKSVEKKLYYMRLGLA
jgi:hypothetical protein